MEAGLADRERGERLSELLERESAEECIQLRSYYDEAKEGKRMTIS